MDFDREKFKALVLHVIWRTSNVRDFGATKLNKVLWFSDARAYEAFGTPISGATYTREKYGPIPEHIAETISELVREGLIQTWTEPHYDLEITRYEAHGPSDTSALTIDELGLVDFWIKHVAEDHTATSISEKSHDFGWKIADQGEVLPFKAFLAKRIRYPMDGEELNWAKNAAAELGSE